MPVTKSRFFQYLSAFCLLITAFTPFKADALVSGTTFDYDIGQGIVTKTDPNNHQIKYSFDDANRLEQVQLFDNTGTLTQTLSYEYTATNRLKRVTYPGGEKVFDYGEKFNVSDFFDVPYTITDFGIDIGFEYDHKSRITRIDYPDGAGSMCYVYDADGRILRVGRIPDSVTSSTCNESGVDITSYSYDGKGRLKSIYISQRRAEFLEVLCRLRSGQDRRPS